MAQTTVPYEIKKVTEEEDALAKKYYKDYVRPFLRVGPPGYFSLPRFGDHAGDLYKLKVRPDDVWVMAFSRSGTTWLQELVWLVTNELDYEGAACSPLYKRYTFIEYSTLRSEVRGEASDATVGGNKATDHDFRDFHTLPSPRYVKTHLPFSLLPPDLLDTAKVLYIARDPRDVAVSFFFMHKLFRYFDEDVTFEDYWQLFKKDLLLHAPVYPHIEEAWQKRTHPNLVFLFYEEMQNDLRGVIERVCEFFSKTYTNEQKQELVKHLSFESMSKKDKSQRSDGNQEIKFMRKGTSGSWINYFNTEKLMEEAKDYMERNLQNTDLRFPEVK